MSDDHLPADVRSLLDEARALPRVPAGARDAVRARLAASLAVPLTAPPAPAPSPSVVAARRLPFTLATFVVGALTGAAAHRALAPRPAPTVIVRTVPTRPAPTPEVPPALPPAPAPAVAAAEVDARPAPELAAPVVVPADVPTRAHGARTHGEGSLNAERAVLEIARTALTRGQSAAAIDALERHARRFPHGRLAPERESMWVQALVSAGRYGSAREHAARFRRSFPGSMLQPVVDAALREIP